jgi:hypothetical protein
MLQQCVPQVIGFEKLCSTLMAIFIFGLLLLDWRGYAIGVVNELLMLLAIAKVKILAELLLP